MNLIPCSRSLANF